MKRSDSSLSKETIQAYDEKLERLPIRYWWLLIIEEMSYMAVIWTIVKNTAKLFIPN